MKHALFGMAKRTPTNQGDKGSTVLVAGRTTWEFHTRLATITGTLEVVLEMSPTGEDGTWVVVATTGVLSAAENKQLSTRVSGDFAITPTETFMFARPRINVLTGTQATFDVVVEAPFLDVETVPDDKLISKALRTFTDGRSRIMTQAELDVISLMQKWARPTHPGGFPAVVTPDAFAEELFANRPQLPYIDAVMNEPGFLEAIKAEIATQAEHLFQLGQLKSKSGDKDSQAAAKANRFAPGLGDNLRQYRPRDAHAFRGR